MRSTGCRSRWRCSSAAIGAVSVFYAVYIQKRELKCACVGGSSRVPLGFVSLTENLFMVGMALWMLLRPMYLRDDHENRFSAAQPRVAAGRGLAVPTLAQDHSAHEATMPEPAADPGASRRRRQPHSLSRAPARHRADANRRADEPRAAGPFRRWTTQRSAIEMAHGATHAAHRTMRDAGPVEGSGTARLPHGRRR